MTDRSDGSDDNPDRPAPARPVRVVRFDDLADDEGERPVRVAGFDDLDASTAEPPRVASLDLARRRRQSPDARPGSGRTPVRRAPDPADGTVGDDARRGRRATASGPRDASGAAAPGVRDATGTAAPGVRGTTGAAAPGPSFPATSASDDDLPPDRPLPRGRRRGGRVGRLGPDAPDPDEPQPEADPVALAREICLRLLTDRARTRQELTQALARKGVPAEATAAVLARFDEVGLIDDAAFAEQWVRSRHAHRGLGRRAIAVELRRKGVADDVAGDALAEVDAESEARRARELVDRKLRSLVVDTADQRAKAANRLIGMLARKGYGAGTAYRVVREALADHGADVDDLGTEPSD